MALALARILMGFISAGYNCENRIRKTILQGSVYMKTYPRQRQPRRAKTGNISEKSNSRSFSSRCSTRNQAGEHQNHAQALPNSTPQKELSSSSTFNDEPGYRGEDGIDDHVDATKEERDLVRLPDTLLEKDREVVDDLSNQSFQIPCCIIAGKKKHTALQPPTCCINCELTPSIIRRKCCVLPPVNKALNGVPFLPA